MRAFIALCPGGVGQNLNTCLIANLFGGSHGFMNMSVFSPRTSFESIPTLSRAR